MKIRKSVLLALSLFLICISALYSQSSSGNLAYEKLVVASSSSQENLEHEADKAVDGNNITYWSSLSGVDPSWIYADLGKVYHVSQVIINWASAYASSYQIQISDDAVTWTDIYSTEAGDGSIDTISGLAVDGRYVRIYGTASATANGYSVYEIEIYGFGLEATSTGDPNNDGIINIIDALMVARHYVGLPVPGFIEANADTNCDGNANILDALLIARYYVGLITEKPNCMVTDTRFLHGRGFYVTPFTEVITTETSGAQIVYTLDGSDPRTSSTAVTGASPLNVQIDPLNSSNRPLTPAVTLRAYAGKANMVSTNVDTQTYIFVENVKTQSASSPGGGWPAPNSSGTGQALDFGIDPDIANDPDYQDLMTDALTSIPSLSLVTDLENLFNSSTGIYVNVDQYGRAWERPGSMEIIDKNGQEVQVNAGIRIRGDWARQEDNPKHSFQIFFREEYGDAKLNYKLFDDEGTEEYEKIDLRSATNYNWAYYGDTRNTMVRDVLCRDLQGKTGQPYTKSRYYHLYLNGLYWGLYQTQEQSEAKYARSYFGGKIEDYDVIKSGGVKNNYLLEATDGTLDLTNLLHSKMIAGFAGNTSYFEVLGINSDGSVNPAGQKLIDPENLIDYMLNIFYSGDKDGPISTFINGGEGINNFYGIINRNNPDGFKWFHHEAEHTLDLGDNDRIGPFPGTALNQPDRFNPQTLNEYLMENTEYKMLFADRAYRHFILDDGAYTPEAVSAQLNLRTGQIDPGAVIAHSARWGDTVTTTPLNYYDNWLPAINNILNSYIPSRSSQIIDLLKQKDWYPDINPPTVKSGAQTVNKRIAELVLNSQITLESTGGTIYYTTDGSDPRAVGGGVSSYALNGGTSTTATLTANGIKARIQNGGVWSPLRELYGISPIDRDALQITEIHYNPAEETGVDESDLEFIELWNSTASPLSLTGVAFSKGILYSFPAGAVIPAHGYIVLASVPKDFTNRYGFAPFGHYDGQLENSGDKLTIRDAFGSTIFSVQYKDSSPWPQTPDSQGNSLVPRQLNSSLNPDDAVYWTASAQVNGSPGVKDSNTIDGTAPVASFITSTITPALSELITFDASSSTDIDGSITSYKWDFGDGNTATGSVVGHSFTLKDDYNVQLVVTDNTGLTDSIKNYIFVGRPEGWTETTHSAEGGASYDLLFDDTTVHRIDITINPGVYAIMEDDMTMIYGAFGGGGTQNTGDDPVWSPVTIGFNGKTWKNVGMRYKGVPDAWHEGIHKLAFRLDFDQFEDSYPDILDQRFYGFKKMTFSNGYRDVSLIRDKHAGDIFRAGGVPAAYGAFCRIYVDSGSGPVYWGLYTMVEDPTNKMLDDQFDDDSGNMYKPEGPGAAWAQPFDQVAFIKMTNEDLADYSDVISAHSALHGNRSNEASWRAVLEYYFNVNIFIKWLAINTIIQNWDSYGIMPWNYYLYQDVTNNGALIWIPWDMGESFKANGEQQPLSLSLDEVSSQWPLIRFLMDDPVYKNKYNTELQAAINGCFAAEAVSTRIQNYHNLISPYVVGIDGEIDGYTFLESDNDFLNSLLGGPDALQTHVTNRHNEVNSYLDTQ